MGNFYTSFFFFDALSFYVQKSQEIKMRKGTCLVIALLLDLMCFLRFFAFWLVL